MRHSWDSLLNEAQLWVKGECSQLDGELLGGHDGTGSGLILRFLPTDSSLTPQQMVGVGLGSVAFVTVLAFLSSSAVWYVGPSLLKNEWNGGEARVGVMPNSWA